MYSENPGTALAVGCLALVLNIAIFLGVVFVAALIVKSVFGL